MDGETGEAGDAGRAAREYINGDVTLDGDVPLATAGNVALRARGRVAHGSEGDLAACDGSVGDEGEEEHCKGRAGSTREESLARNPLARASGISLGT